jgi:hypothetical protein
MRSIEVSAAIVRPSQQLLSDSLFCPATIHNKEQFACCIASARRLHNTYVAHSSQTWTLGEERIT